MSDVVRQMDQAPAEESILPARRIARHKIRIQTVLGIFGAALVIGGIFSALFAPWLAPQDPNKIDLANRLAPPTFVQSDSEGGILGKDALGRDILSRILYGARISMLVGFVSVFISGSLGTMLGMFAGYRGGRTDSVLMALADILYAIPFLVLIIAITTLLGGGTVQVILYLGFANWITFARVVRGDVLSIRERDYIEAARAIGASDWRIMRRHILPNVLAPVIIVMALGFGAMVLTESALSFLGLGVSPNSPSWGRMVADARDYVKVAWWPAVFPGFAIMLVVLGMNLFGDWLRDILDPRLRRSA
jgi:peptide/nickel transport system permease protein